MDQIKFDKPVKVLIVSSDQSPDCAGLAEFLEKHSTTFDTITVPGLSEIAPAIGIAERMSNFDGYIALGSIGDAGSIQNETAFREAYHALTLLGLQGLCVGNGISFGDSSVNHENKAVEAATAALHLIALSRKWGARTKGIGFRSTFEDYQIASGGSTA